MSFHITQSPLLNPFTVLENDINPYVIVLHRDLLSMQEGCELYITSQRLNGLSLNTLSPRLTLLDEKSDETDCNSSWSNRYTGGTRAPQDISIQSRFSSQRVSFPPSPSHCWEVNDVNINVTECNGSRSYVRIGWTDAAGRFGDTTYLGLHLRVVRLMFSGSGR